MRRRGTAPGRRILRQYISITHKKKNKSFQVAERPDYSRGENNKKGPGNEPGSGDGNFRKENVWGEKDGFQGWLNKLFFFTRRNCLVKLLRPLRMSKRTQMRFHFNIFLGRSEVKWYCVRSGVRGFGGETGEDLCDSMEFNYSAAMAARRRNDAKIFMFIVSAIPQWDHTWPSYHPYGIWEGMSYLFY